jgi:hypothetical protein
MTPAEQVEHDRAIDTLVAAALPPMVELEHLTFDTILAVYTPLVVQAATALGVHLTASEVEAVLERLVGVKEVPPFRRQDYDVLC